MEKKGVIVEKLKVARRKVPTPSPLKGGIKIEYLDDPENNAPVLGELVTGNKADSLLSVFINSDFFKKLMESGVDLSPILKEYLSILSTVNGKNFSNDQVNMGFLSGLASYILSRNNGYSPEQAKAAVESMVSAIPKAASIGQAVIRGNMNNKVAGISKGVEHLLSEFINGSQSAGVDPGVAQQLSTKLMPNLIDFSMNGDPSRFLNGLSSNALSVLASLGADGALSTGVPVLGAAKAALQIGREVGKTIADVDDWFYERKKVRDKYNLEHPLSIGTTHMTPTLRGGPYVPGGIRSPYLSGGSEFSHEDFVNDKKIGAWIFGSGCLKGGDDFTDLYVNATAGISDDPNELYDQLNEKSPLETIANTAALGVGSWLFPTITGVLSTLNFFAPTATSWLTRATDKLVAGIPRLATRGFAKLTGSETVKGWADWLDKDYEKRAAFNDTEWGRREQQLRANAVTQGLQELTQGYLQHMAQIRKYKQEAEQYNNRLIYNRKKLASEQAAHNAAYKKDVARAKAEHQAKLDKLKVENANIRMQNEMNDLAANREKEKDDATADQFSAFMNYQNEVRDHDSATKDLLLSLNLGRENDMSKRRNTIADLNKEELLHYNQDVSDIRSRAANYVGKAIDDEMESFGNLKPIYKTAVNTLIDQATASQNWQSVVGKMDATKLDAASTAFTKEINPIIKDLVKNGKITNSSIPHIEEAGDAIADLGNTIFKLTPSMLEDAKAMGQASNVQDIEATLQKYYDAVGTSLQERSDIALETKKALIEEGKNYINQIFAWPFGLITHSESYDLAPEILKKAADASATVGKKIDAGQYAINSLESLRNRKGGPPVLSSIFVEAFDKAKKNAPQDWKDYYTLMGNSAFRDAKLLESLNFDFKQPQKADMTSTLQNAADLQTLFARSKNSAINYNLEAPRLLDPNQFTGEYDQSQLKNIIDHLGKRPKAPTMMFPKHSEKYYKRAKLEEYPEPTPIIPAYTKPTMMEEPAPTKPIEPLSFWYYGPGYFFSGINKYAPSIIQNQEMYVLDKKRKKREKSEKLERLMEEYLKSRNHPGINTFVSAGPSSLAPPLRTSIQPFVKQNIFPRPQTQVTTQPINGIVQKTLPSSMSSSSAAPGEKPTFNWFGTSSYMPTTLSSLGEKRPPPANNFIPPAAKRTRFGSATYSPSATSKFPTTPSSFNRGYASIPQRVSVIKKK